MFSSMLFVGACSDNDKDEPNPIPQPEYPSEETFKNEIENNLWERVEERFETEDGVDFPGLSAGDIHRSAL